MPKATRDQLPPEYQELWDELIMPVDTNIDFSKVILSEENKSKYSAFINEQKNKQKLFKYDLEPMNRLLLYGASGVGKTFSLKALSNLLDYTMIYVDIAKSLTEGNVAMNISKIFKLGNYIADNFDGAIIFLDECDAVAWNRDAGNSDGGTIRRATNSIFQGLDQMSKNCVFAAATNMLHRLDAAFERRFNLKLMFTRPKLNLDDSIKHFLSNKFVLNDDVDPTTKNIVERRAEQNQKLSYYELEQLVKRAMKRSILNDTTIVKTSDIYNDLIESMNIKLYFHTESDDPAIFSNNNSYNPM